MFDVKKQKASTGIPIWQGNYLKNAQGGFSLEDNAFKSGEDIPAGTAVSFDESTRKAKVAKVAVMQANATNSDTTYKVLKNHLLKVGMQVKHASASAQEITAIDRSQADYDTITLKATLGVKVDKDKSLFVDDEGYKNAKGLLYESVTIGNNGLVDTAVTIAGIVYARRIPPVPSELKEKMTNIIFSESF